MTAIKLLPKHREMTVIAIEPSFPATREQLWGNCRHNGISVWQPTRI
ncbi:MAG: hypothetical protein JRG94_06785 [Deltaproteobacteria bacterium]|nr:hypothetical protein [Deltaproteobacteria bacterium]MBW2723990.1 hypothetical protein [Deltaproteobacteria bacterium]